MVVGVHAPDIDILGRVTSDERFDPAYLGLGAAQNPMVVYDIVSTASGEELVAFADEWYASAEQTRDVGSKNTESSSGFNVIIYGVGGWDERASAPREDGVFNLNTDLCP